ncbi:TPA: hypothetical protein DEG21_03380 [Patescibacteria group bacterium]|nr:hypothetical protein [Candidatus Gracilibacteria bacterium]HBY74900.1 hypothetical protein [Candidatus Gracilibacteria bacterium]
MYFVISRLPTYQARLPDAFLILSLSNVIDSLSSSVPVPYLNLNLVIFSLSCFRSKVKLTFLSQISDFTFWKILDSVALILSALFLVVVFQSALFRVTLTG